MAERHQWSQPKGRISNYFTVQNQQCNIATKSTKEMEINSTETCTALKYKTKIAIECQLTGMTQKTGTREKTLRIRIEKSL